jgi:Chromo (CHRromatin Organisation MOdifier) domain
VCTEVQYPGLRSSFLVTGVSDASVVLSAVGDVDLAVGTVIGLARPVEVVTDDTFEPTTLPQRTNTGLCAVDLFSGAGGCSAGMKEWLDVRFQATLLRQNAKLAAALGLRATFREGEKVWLYRKPLTHSVSTTDGATSLSRKFLNYWQGPFEVLCVGPGSLGSGDSATKVGANCLLIMRGDSPQRVSVHLCKKCRDPTDMADRPTGLPDGFAKYLLTTRPTGVFGTASVDDNEATWESDRHGVEAVVDHRIVTHARGRQQTLEYRVRWEGDYLADTWEPAENLDSCPEAMSEYWHQLSISSEASGIAIRGGITQVVRGRLRQADKLRKTGFRLAYGGTGEYK